MTHFFRRTAILLVATSALCASPALARTHHHPAKKGHTTHHAAPAAGANGTIVTLPGEASTYVVKKGDTLAKIADQLNTTVADLKRDNKLKGNDITPGQELKGPSGGERKAYVVAHGDTPYSIAQKFHVSVGDLRSENGLSAKASIKSGQKLKLPVGFKAPANLAEESAQASRGSKASTAESGGGDQGGSRTAAGRVETVPGGATSYKVKKGDTLGKVADKMGISVSELKRLNHLKGNSISPGRRLKGPSSGTSRVYVAASGDTLQGISTRFGVSVQALKAANGMKKKATTVHGGQRLHLPGAARDHGSSDAIDRATVGYPRPAEPDRGAALPSQPQPYQPNGPVRPYNPSAGTPGQPPSVAPQVSAGPTDAQVMSMGKGRFQWPLKGDLISDFGPLTGGQRNDGINIRAAAGDPVRSAADGDVVYAGDQVPGFGNLVLIKHADGWVTAYGHLSHVDVKMQQKVTQGQQIGQAGQSGGVTETQLHFEVRYAPNPLERARPVDPKLVLPK